MCFTLFNANGRKSQFYFVEIFRNFSKFSEIFRNIAFIFLQKRSSSVPSSIGTPVTVTYYVLCRRIFQSISQHKTLQFDCQINSWIPKKNKNKKNTRQGQRGGKVKRRRTKDPTRERLSLMRGTKRRAAEEGADNKETHRDKRDALTRNSINIRPFTGRLTMQCSVFPPPLLLLIKGASTQQTVWRGHIVLIASSFTRPTQVGAAARLRTSRRRFGKTERDKKKP